MMKTILFILLFSTCIFATVGDSLITTFELPAVTTNNDSLLQWFVDVLSPDSTDTTTRKLTYSVLLDLMAADSSFSEQSLTAAFNTRLDLFLTLATTEIDTNNFVVARRVEWRGFAATDDSVDQDVTVNSTPQFLSVQVSDSVVTAAKIAEWQSAADSVDQSVIIGSAPVLDASNMTNVPGDSLWNHVATQNIVLGSNYLSGDGGNEGIKIDSMGYVQFLPVTTACGPVEFMPVEVNNNGISYCPGRFGIRIKNTLSNNDSRIQIENDAGKKLSMQVRGSHYVKSSIYNSAAIFGEGIAYMTFSTTGTAEIRFEPGGVEAARFEANGNVGIATTTPDSGRLVVHDGNPWGIVVGDKAVGPWSAMHAGDASYTTSSDTLAKNITKRKKTLAEIARRKLFANIKKVDELEYTWKPEAIRHKFSSAKIAEWDSLDIAQQDSARVAWNIREEKYVAKVTKRKHFGPGAQDIAATFGGDGKSINWDKVNSQYRQALKELIIVVEALQVQVDSLKAQNKNIEKRLMLLERKRQR